MKTLRGLRGKQPRTVLSAVYKAVRTRPERIRHRQPRCGSGVHRQCRDHAIDHGSTHAGARGIVDQHRVAVGQGGKACLNRLAPLSAALRHS